MCDAGPVGGTPRPPASRVDEVQNGHDEGPCLHALATALASRAVVDQALGIIMAQQRCTADDAFALLRRTSQNRNVKLRDVAAGIVTAVSGQPPADRPRFS